MNEKQNDYLSKNYQRICDRIRRYKFIPPLDYDDCISYVIEKMCYKIEKYKTTGNFDKYLNKIIKMLILDYYNKANYDSVAINENLRLQGDDEQDDFWINKRDYAIACEINELKTYNRNILLLYFYDGLNETEIARIIGVTQQTISNHLKKALDTIKPKIDKRLKELDEIRSEL